MRAEPYGYLVWYDPTKESLHLSSEPEPQRNAGVAGFREGDDDETSILIQPVQRVLFSEEIHNEGG